MSTNMHSEEDHVATLPSLTRWMTLKVLSAKISMPTASIKWALDNLTVEASIIGVERRD